MQFAFDYTSAGIVILGILVAVVALLGPFGEIFISILNYLRKLFAGPVKTEPFADKNAKPKKS